jgi:inner membrane protein
MATTHLALATCLYLGLRVIGVDMGVDLVLAAVLVGSVFPDIDHPYSSMAQQSLLFEGVSSAVSSLGGHRGVVHSLSACSFLTAALYVFLNRAGFGGAVAWGFGFGYLTHLLGDSMTKSGIKWLQPFGDWKVRGPLRTGSTAEELLLVLLLALILYELLVY